MNGWGLYTIFIAGCIGLSFVFSGMEAGVFALKRWRIRQLMREGRRSATLLNSFLDQSESFLWTILIGNTLTAFAAITLVAYGLYRVLAPHPFAMLLVFLVAVFLFYAIADLLPKMLFRIFPNRLCMFLAAPFKIIYMGLSPVVSIIEWLSNVLLRWTGGRAFQGQIFSSRNELRLAMQESGQAFTSEEKAMINRVLDLESRTIREIMLPLNRAPSISDDMTVEQVYAVYRENPRNSLPVWQQTGTTRRIAGMLNLKQILFKLPSDSKVLVKEVLRPALYLNLDLRVEQALRRMQRSGHRMAIVLAHDRREIGLVSLEEILKVIFGEVRL
ncbi:MAG: Mg2+ and Co2+ transporter CorB [Verrucomicrobiales bacterium]|nr:Mg2+ and Co2+ transporter CorB [Verrucomicrobiales bacterium]